MTPLDVVKTRLQTQQKRMVSNKCFVYCNGLMDHLCPCPCPNGEIKALKTQTTHYTGMTVRTFSSRLTFWQWNSFTEIWHSFKKWMNLNGFFLSLFLRKQDALFKISRHEGMRSLWSGLSPTLILAVPATICYFVSYEATRLSLKDFYLKHNPSKFIISIICYFGISK